jgi:hypothetical protein
VSRSAIGHPPAAAPRPVGIVEWRIRQHEVGPQILELVAVEAALVVPADIRVDAAHREVHLGKAPGGVVALLPVDRDGADPAAVLQDECLGLHEHPARAAARVVDAAAFLCE